MSYSEGWLVKREEYSQFANAELARNSRLSCLYQDWNQNKRMKLYKCCATCYRFPPLGPYHIVFMDPPVKYGE